VNPCLYTSAPHQYAAFYDENRQMTVMHRTLDSNTWTTQKLDEHVIWDSHNYIALAVDSEGQLHLSGNMHVSPLVYFRTETPHDITTLTSRTAMTGSEEVKVTYPKFFLDGAGELMFTYRDGGSGKGDQIFNRYVPKAKLWTRAMFRPLTDGEGARNAYFDDFQRGADGYLHLCWVWRETSDAATTNTLSHVRTRDFKTWENAKGEKVPLPIRRGAPVEVDPVPQGGGILNTNTKLGFAPNGAPVIVYHKHDANGNTQVHVAGWNGSVWVITPMTEYDYRWEFGGGGTLVGEIGVRRPTTGADGALSVQWNHKKFGTHRRLIDPTTFAALDEVPALSDGIPNDLRQPGSSFPEIQVRFVWDSGTSPDPARKSLLRWECLPANRDQPRGKPWPDPMMLRLYDLPAPELQ
jgi:hypothetical protein